MHQPWASLLVTGIKKYYVVLAWPCKSITFYRHEGRVWYTPHRGRLWIASTRQEPSVDDIKTVQQLYQSLHDGQKPFYHVYVNVGRKYILFQFVLIQSQRLCTFQCVLVMITPACRQPLKLVTLTAAWAKAQLCLRHLTAVVLYHFNEFNCEKP